MLEAVWEQCWGRGILGLVWGHSQHGGAPTPAFLTTRQGHLYVRGCWGLLRHSGSVSQLFPHPLSHFPWGMGQATWGESPEMLPGSQSLIAANHYCLATPPCTEAEDQGIWELDVKLSSHLLLHLSVCASPKGPCVSLPPADGCYGSDPPFPDGISSLCISSKGPFLSSKGPFLSSLASCCPPKYTPTHSLALAWVERGSQQPYKWGHSRDKGLATLAALRIWEAFLLPSP